MILFTSLKTLLFLIIALRIILPMLILRILKIECFLPENRLMIAMMRSPMIPRTHLIHPFLMILILALLMAMMPLWMMLTKMNLLSLLEKRPLMAHPFWPLMAHIRCAITSTPLVADSNGAHLVRHYYLGY